MSTHDAKKSGPTASRPYTDEELTRLALMARARYGRILMQHRALQAEAYASYCEREALVEAEARERTRHAAAPDPEEP